MLICPVTKDKNVFVSSSNVASLGSSTSLGPREIGEAKCGLRRQKLAARTRRWDKAELTEYGG